MAEVMSMQPRTGKTYAARMELKEKIRKAEQELTTAGPIHARDLRKHIKRMRVQLRRYDAYQARREAG